MKVAFIQNFWYEYLGVMSISAVVKKRGHEARVFISGEEKNLLDAVARFDPEVIAFPIYTGSHSWVLETAREMKKKLGKLTLLGGPHATFFPEIIEEKGIDVVCRGEGEYPLLELLEALARKRSFAKIPNLWVKKGRKLIRNPLRPLIDPLDQLPLLDREIYYHYRVLAKNPVKNFHIGRGCPYDCAYCHNQGLIKIYRGKGAYVRYHRPQRVIEEILQVKKKYPLKTVGFVDDTFILDKRWLSEFLPLYKKKVGLPFAGNVRGDLLTRQLAEDLARAGCISVFMGVETGSEKRRIEILKKKVTNRELKRSARLLHQSHIQLAANNMVGLPGESLKEALETVRFNAVIKTDLPWCALFQPYPGTALADYCLEKGYLRRRDLEQIGASFLKGSVLKTKDIKKLINLQKLFHLGVWFPALIPVIKILVELPLTFLYDFIFLINQGLTYVRFFRLSPTDFFPHAWHFGRFYLRSRR